jgi:hypothetical protein
MMVMAIVCNFHVRPSIRIHCTLNGCNGMVSSLKNIVTFQQGKQPSDSSLKKTMKEEKIRKKDDKSVEQVLKALNSLETTEEKLAAMCKKYADIVDENRKLQVTFDVKV